MCQDADGLATVLANLMAHTIAHHAAEKLSADKFVVPLAHRVLSLLGVSDERIAIASHFAWELPRLSKQEVMIYSSRSCPEWMTC